MKGHSLVLMKNTFYLLTLVFALPLTACAQGKRTPETAVSFTKTQLLDKYLSEGVSTGDIDGDGHVDILAGVIWWQGPSFEKKFAFAPVTYFPIVGPGVEGYSTNFFSYLDHFDGDEYLDVLLLGLPGTDSKWVSNPGKTKKSLSDSILEPTYNKAVDKVCHESPSLINVIGDERKEYLAFHNGHLVLGIPSSSPMEEWKTLAISPYDADRFPVYSHGLGAGDINDDGLVDVFEKSGWWEQTKNWDQLTPWQYHPYPFSSGTGGSQMFAYDVDGDGDSDVVTALNGHGYGLSWHEQIVGSQNEITFKEHRVMTDSPADNPYGVSFSQLHAMESADIDGDGILDIVTGKCYYAHNGRDPGSEEPAVLYWFKTTRHADGYAELVPYKIDDNSGVGRQIVTADLNQDGKTDIVTSNKKGVFVFIQH